MIGVQAQETPTNDGIYYLYNSETDLFLSRGNDWGTQAVANPVALPWEVSISGGNYTLRMYDLTVAGSTTGLGSNGFTDNGSPLQFTPSGNATDGFTLKNGNNYITCPASAGVVTLSTTASAWKFLTQAQYNDVLAARVAAQESAVAAAKGIVIPAGKTLNDVVSDADNWASTFTNDGVPTSSKWTATKHGGRGGNLNWGGYGSEMYQCGDAHYTRTISGLKKGIYKVTIRGMKRMGSNETCTTMGDAGYPVSDSYLTANGNVIRFKAWYEDRVSNTNPNSTSDFVNIVNNGGYTTEGFAYVGDDGNLVLDAFSEAYWGGSWFLFNGISYTFYNNEVSDEDAAEIIATAESTLEKKMGDLYSQAISDAKTTFEAAKTIANYNALNTAISNAAVSIASYAELQTAITNAQNNTSYKTAFPAGTTIYNDAVTAAQGVYDAATVDNCSAAIAALTDGIHSAYESDYGSFATYAYDYSTLLNPDLTKWASSDYVVMTANEHWNGLNGQRYYEQSSAEWGQASWDHEASQTVTLPAGNYVMSITARASADVNSSMSVQLGNSTPVVVTLANKGSVGRGIMTNGVGSYQDGTYARNGEGFGWEYRYIAFTVAEESLVTFKFNSSVSGHEHNWVSIANPLLKGDVHPNQIKVNQIKSMAITLRGYEGQITPATFATFADDLAAADAATVETTNLDDIIVSLQNDIETAQAEKDAFARGAAMNALISGDNSVVLNDEATAANWTPVPTYNDWSTEADESGMVKPFLQDWIAKDQSPLSDNGHNYASIRGLQNGYYEVSALVRIYAENGDAPSATSATFTVNGVSDNLLDGTSFEYNNMKGIYKTVTIRMQVEDALNIGLAYSGATFNWISWKNLKVTYLCNVPADAADYAALNAAIETAEGKTLGFEDGEYAPYNNIEALQALADAKAINQSEINSKSFVQAATTALTGATWTANAEELNAVYDGNFAIQPEHATGPTALAGWNNPEGIRQLIKNTETYPGLNTASAKAAVFAWGGTTMKYGETDGYTIPLKGHAIYELSFKTCGWADGDMGNVNVDVKNASDEGLQTVSTVVATKRITEENPWDEFKILFVTGEAGNYKLGMWTSKHTTFTDIVLKKAASQTLTFADDAAMPAFAPGTYPSVRVNRTLNTGEDVWNTLVLPFDYTNAEWAVRELTSSTEDNLSFSVVEGGAMTAGKPYLVRPNAEVTSIEAENVAVITTPTAVEKGKYSFIPVFAPTTITGDGTNYFVATGTNKLYCAKANIATNGYRAYFHYTGTSSGARSVFLNFDETDPTAINAVEAAEAESGALKDGKYIIDNKVVIVKNGVKYGANGQKLN